MNRIRHALLRTAALGALVGPALALAQPSTPQFVQFIPNSAGIGVPIGIVNAGDGSNRLFVNEQGGQVRVIKNGALLGTNFLDLSVGGGLQCTYPGNASPSTVGFSSGGEQGLLGLAFHPQYESNGRIFVSFSDASGDTMIARFTVANPTVDALTPADFATCTVILRADQDFSNHNGGNLAFGSDGYLYFGLGDGGSGGDPCSRGQTLDPATLATTDSANAGCPVDNSFVNAPAAGNGDPNSRALLGKMLRLDVNGTTAAGIGQLCGRPRVNQPTEYAIPTGQPSTSGGPIAQACDEVWSYGWRNPWRWSFDRATGDLIVGDVGQGSIEEVSFEPAGVGGRNYGWRCFEGNNTNSTSGLCSSLVVPHTPPIITYSHINNRCSMTGGFRYRGTVTGVTGQIFYGDLCSREVWGSVLSGSNWSQPGAAFQTMPSAITAFGEDDDGNLYIAIAAVYGGTLNEIWVLDGPRSPSETVFRNGFEP